MRKQLLSMLALGVLQVGDCGASALAKDYDGNNISSARSQQYVLRSDASSLRTLLAQSSSVQPWGLNLRKGNTGSGTISIPLVVASTATIIRAVVTNSDQTVTVAGATSSEAQLLVARLLPNLSGLDDSYTFIQDSNPITGLTGLQSLTCLVSDQAGGYYVGGYGLSGPTYVGIVAHVGSSAMFDSSFGTNGVQRTLGTTVGYVAGIALQSTGKIVYAGATTVMVSGDLVVGRLTNTGAVDATFTIYNTTTTGITISASTVPLGIAVDSQDRILVVGSSVTPNMVVARFNPNGGLDTTFNAAGTTPGIFTTSGSGYAVTVASDGSIIAAGMTAPVMAGPAYYKVIKLTPQGVLDPTFGNGTGIVTLDPGLGAVPGATASAYSVMILPNGNIAASGPVVTATGVQADFGTLMLTSTGLPVTQFFGTGYYTYNFGGNATPPYGITYQGGLDPSLVAVGYSNGGRVGLGLVFTGPLTS